MSDNNGYDRSSVIHGGDVYRNNVELDFSVSLNPEPVPSEVENAAFSGVYAMDRYPDPLYTELRQAITAFEEVDPDEVLCGNGASELIMGIVHAVMPRKALIVSPCYAGYEIALAAAGAEVEEYMLVEGNDFKPDAGFLDMIEDDTDLIFLGNPNNPVGNLIDEDLLEAICAKCKETGTVLVLDECFIHLTNRYDQKPDLTDGAIHLRAFTKTFSMPGIRCGYMLSGDRKLLSEVRKHLPEWNVSVVANQAGIAAAKVLKETDYLERSVRNISRNRLELVAEAALLRVKMYRSNANYLLIRSRYDLYGPLLSRGILVRKCDNFHGLDDSFIRIGIKSRRDNFELVNAIKEIMKERSEDDI